MKKNYKVGLSKKIFVVSLFFVVGVSFFVSNIKTTKASDPITIAITTYQAAAVKDPHNWYCGNVDYATAQITMPLWWECRPVYIPKMKSSTACKTPPVLDVTPIVANPIKTISFTWGPTVPKPATPPTAASNYEQYKSELVELNKTDAGMSKNLSRLGTRSGGEDQCNL